MIGLLGSYILETFPQHGWEDFYKQRAVGWHEAIGRVSLYLPAALPGLALFLFYLYERVWPMGTGFVGASVLDALFLLVDSILIATIAFQVSGVVSPSRPSRGDVH